MLLITPLKGVDGQTYAIAQGNLVVGGFMASGGDGSSVMVLGQGVLDQDGGRHAMAGLLGLETSFARRKLHLGYRQVRLRHAGPLGAKDAAYRGHEFHYATVTEELGEDLFTARDALGQHDAKVGLRSGTVMGSFIHLIDRDNRTTT